jgi:branched-chain amino acid transport system substrate-binding protein
MRKVAQNLVVGGVAALLLIGVSGCASPGASDDSGEAPVYQIGAALPLSGPSATLGKDFLVFIEYGVDDFNANLAEEYGFTLEVRAEDTQGTTEGGAAAIDKLSGIGDSPYIIAAWSPAVQAMAPRAVELDVAIMNAGAGDSGLEGASPNLLNLYPLNSQKLKAIGKYAAEELGGERAGVFFVDNASGATAVEDYSSGFEAAGGEVVGEQAIQPAAVDASAQVAKLAAEDLDTVHLQVTTEGAAIFNAMRDQGLTGLNVTMEAAVAQDPAVRTSAGALMNGAIYSGGKVPTVDDPLLAELVERYREDFNGADPLVLTFAGYQYDAVMLFAQAAKELRDAGKEVTGTNIVETLKSRAFTTPAIGEVSFNANGLFPSQVNIFKVVDSSKPVSSDEVIAVVKAG